MFDLTPDIIAVVDYEDRVAVIVEEGMRDLKLRQEKRPGSVVNYQMDWTRWLAGEKITASRWEVIEGDESLEILAHDHTERATTVRLGGGTAGRRAKLRNYVTLRGGAEDYRTFNFVLRER